MQVLTLLTKYEPVSEDETFSLMNYLDPILRTTNSGVVLAAVKCFIHLTRNMHDLHPQVSPCSHWQRKRWPSLIVWSEWLCGSCRHCRCTRG